MIFTMSYLITYECCIHTYVRILLKVGRVTVDNHTYKKCNIQFARGNGYVVHETIRIMKLSHFIALRAIVLCGYAYVSIEACSESQ